ncbi:MAG: type I restriction endonuclease subunit R [Cyanobacteria bacterium J06649_4]
MVQTVQSRDVSLEDLKQQFGLQIDTQQELFDELHSDFSELSPFEKQQLRRVQRNYTNLSNRKSFSEEAVKMVVLSPLLDLANFYQAPFGLNTEEAIELTSKDEGFSVKGKIDVLVVRQQLWVLVIESKSTQFDVLSALPQALTYLLSAPTTDKPVYGLLVNGREFVFVKLMQLSKPVYARSFALSIERKEELETVLNLLKVIQHKMLSPQD